MASALITCFWCVSDIRLECFVVLSLLLWAMRAAAIYLKAGNAAALRMNDAKITWACGCYREPDGASSARGCEIVRSSACTLV
jgi:hypothetical protein